MIDAYPLSWPIGRERTLYLAEARFYTSFAHARDNLLREIALLVGSRRPDVIISTNIPVRRDGIPYAATRQPDDPGVAIYFDYKGKQRCFACDRWRKVEDNMQAVCKTIEALRGIARWGTGDMLEAAFTGFTALPAPNERKSWREIFGYQNDAPLSLEQVRVRYRQFASSHHPDKGGTDKQMAEINQAWEQAQRELTA